jgi:hypothetical protein
MVEVPENNRNANESKFKNKVEFSLPYEGYKENPLTKQNDAENYKSRLLGSIEKRATNVKKSKQLGYRAADDIVADVHSPKKLLNLRARQGINLARGVDAGEEETRHKYAASLKEVSRNIDSPYKGKQRKASPVKAQYEDFKVKFGITAEQDSVISMSPESKKSKVF